MTNLELQAIGIDADKWTAATDRQRIEWGKANTTSGLGLHDKAFEWLESQPQNVIYHCLSEWTKAVDRGTIQRDSYCYRLRPDYEEKVKPAVNIDALVNAEILAWNRYVASREAVDKARKAGVQ